MSTPLEAKAAGAAAWGAGNFSLAVEKFTAALDAEKAAENDKTFVKTVLSNRSAAYMKLDNRNAALLDADECVALDPNWPKGYVRRGDALYALSRFTECYNAYNSAYRLDMSDAAVKRKCELAERAIRNSASSNAGTSANVSSRPTSFLSSGQAYLRLFVILNAVVYFFLSFFAVKIGRFCYRNFVFGSIADYTIALYTAHGLPKFNMEYASRVMTDASAMYLFLSLLLLMQRPYILAMAPLFLTALLHSVHYMHSVIARKSPDLLNRVSQLSQNYAPAVLRQSQSSWNALSTSSKWQLFDKELIGMAAYAELLQGIALLFELIFPSRNFLGTMMWWQYLQMRYMMDQEGSVKAAFGGVDRKIQTLLQHKFCPSALNTAYCHVRSFCENKVKLPSPDEPAPSMSNMMSKCTIM